MRNQGGGWPAVGLGNRRGNPVLWATGLQEGTIVGDLDSREDRVTLTPTEARAGRIVKGGAVLRVLVVSLVLAVAVLLVAYLLLARSG
jgi:hypothetical protein